MQRCHSLVGTALMVALPVCMAARLIYDLTHPENWNGDWFEDPRRYWPVAVAEVVLIAVLACICWREARSGIRKQTKTAMLWSILDEARQAQEHGQWDEANEWLDRYEKLSKT